MVKPSGNTSVSHWIIVMPRENMALMSDGKVTVALLGKVRIVVGNEML